MAAQEEEEQQSSPPSTPTSNSSTTTGTYSELEEQQIDVFDQYHKRNDTIIIEGDIMATWESISLLYSSEYATSIGLLAENGAEQRGTLAPVWRDYYWYNDWRPKTEIWQVDVFLTPGVFNAKETKRIKKALRQFYTLTGVIKAKFLRARPTLPTHYIEIVKDGGCWSYIGKPPSWTVQAMSLDNGCVYNGIIQHEFLHALGFYHEHSRPDRDNYVTINLENVRDGYEYNFAKVSSTEIDSLGSPYDYKSLMHYGEYSFSVNGQKTIDTRGNDLGNMKKLSVKDRIQVSPRILNCYIE
jgi:hypothetical protein